MSNNGAICWDYFPPKNLRTPCTELFGATLGLEVRLRSKDTVEGEVSMEFTSKASIHT